MVPGVFGGSRSHSDRRAEAGAGFCSVGKVAGVPAGTTIMAYSTHGASGQSVLTVAMIRRVPAGPAAGIIAWETRPVTGCSCREIGRATCRVGVSVRGDLGGGRIIKK